MHIRYTFILLVGVVRCINIAEVRYKNNFLQSAKMITKRANYVLMTIDMYKFYILGNTYTL